MTERNGSAPDALRVLVVEDNEVNQRLIRFMLAQMHCDVTLAEHGGVALESLRRQRFDLIFMDCHMPVMDGYQTTEAIRALDGELRKIPIVAITANAMPGNRERCLESGMNDYLSKPATFEQLQQMLDKWARVAV